MSSVTGDDLKLMLASFRVIDLRKLLGAFSLKRTGNKCELKNRALVLLKSRPSGLNYPAYTAKIVEIYHSKPHVSPDNKKMVHNMIKTEQLKIKSMDTQPQQQRMIQSPQYPQSINSAHAGLPQVQRVIYGNSNSNIRGNGYNPTCSRGMSIAQVPVNQQISMISTDQVGFDINAAPPKNFTLSTPSLVNVKLRKLPFYEIVDEIVKPTVLTGEEKCTLPHYPKGMRETVFKVILSPEQCSYIGLNRDFSNGRNYYYYQIQIRFCYLDPAVNEITDLMPLGLHIEVNDINRPLPSSKIARKTPRPIDCTHIFKLCPDVPNFITIKWTPDENPYVIAIYLAKELNCKTLLQKLKDKGARSVEETKKDIIRMLAVVDPDVATTPSFRFSLVCPYSSLKMKIPAKSITCNHLQCFDLSSFIETNKTMPKWICPHCKKSCFYDDIQIQSYFLDVVSNQNLPDTCKEIELLADGSWKVYEKKEYHAIDVESEVINKEKPIDFINLDDSDDDGNNETVATGTKPEPKPKSLEDTEKLKPTFVNLTRSIEEQPTEEDKQKNKAQSADAFQK